ncbi:DNA polymerase III subunit gamma/tau [Mesorhizobium sp. B2-5-9]|uniref:DNA polymerase III subunit gamma/tau n=1 Tax=unclassified Mesorhizobium TaxID=325217 RepID=UPI0011292FA4|nr:MULTISPECIES: DNA polymerase III subunit gamma/tau [unclassified Mesorhizobium]TPK24537.1 DNA polymerase III subunit gamma/tau [Mesorhizobium sp. B2-5-9]TPK87993.1 DNA polymerase III subunit gamma/tau [Mesorhizobium sp. B2-4-13]
MSEAGNSGPDSLATGKAAAYRVLARKYRPSNFSELVGQEPMVRTLTNAFATGRIAQAWMLTGVRGVGKTTTARILARALNYKTATTDQPSVDLAVLGEHCQAIMEGRHVDVIEMDAASHTGIDDIRDIIERVRYAPVSARYKVYIIDEVHMLSTQAFNGLLKTLEEPPPHVKFIFATTEIRKVPITVLSRCQRFDLRRIDAGALVSHLSSIAGKEGISVDDDALAMIARAAEGSARDSLSILDQAIAHGAGSVSAEAVRAMLGLADRARIVDLFEHVMKGDVAAALGEFRAQYDTGADPAAVLTDLAEFNHLVTRLRFVPTAMDDASLSQDERQRGADFARALSVRVLSRTWQMLLKGIPEVQSSNRPVSAAEMVLIRLAHAADLPTLDEALRSLESGASATGAAPRPNGAPMSPGPVNPGPVNPGNGGAGGNGAGAVAQARMPGGSGGAQTMRLVEATPTPTAFVAPPQPAPEVQTVPLKSLADIVALADAKRDIAFKVLIKSCIRLVRIEPGRIDVSLTDDAPKMLLNDLTTKLRAWTGRNWLVSLSKEEGGQTLAEMESTKRENAFLDARNDPTVASILARFPGAKIIDVRIPDTPDADASEAEMPVEPPADDDEP